MFRRFGCALLTAVFCTPATAEEIAFKCVSKAVFADEQAGNDTVRVNNFSIRERDALLGAGAKVVDVSFSVSNRHDATVYMDAAFVGLSEAGDIVFALSAKPTFGMVQANETTVAKGDVYAPKGSLAKAAQVCMKVTVLAE